jgi:cobalt/nickel transport system permease protein
MWFHNSSGAPLYAPYPLHIAVPAMMIGHLGPAGIAEALVSAGLLSWLQRTEPGLLRATAPGAAMSDPVGPTAPTRGWWPSTRKLWAMLGVLMILTPLGLLATGAAWGEWGTEAFSHAETRQQIALASADQALPPGTPTGLARLSSLWNSPMPGYEPPFLRGSAGYVLSALLGTGLVILLWLAAGRLLAAARRRGPQP